MTSLHDAAKAAALAERDRLRIGRDSMGWKPALPANDYVIGRCVEAALSVIEGRPVEPGPAVVDAASEEIGRA